MLIFRTFFVHNFLINSNWQLKSSEGYLWLWPWQHISRSRLSAQYNSPNLYNSFFFKNSKHNSQVSAEVPWERPNTAERYPATDICIIMHVGVPLGENIRIELCRICGTAKNLSYKRPDFYKRGFLFWFLLDDSTDLITILIRYEHFSAARIRLTSCSGGEAYFASTELLTHLEADFRCIRRGKIRGRSFSASIGHSR